MKRMIAAVLMLSLLLTAACAGKKDSPTESNEDTKTTGTEDPGGTGTEPGETETEDPVSYVPILDFEGIPGGKKLKEDMEAGRIPVECNVLYDQMGSLPDVTVTDPATITKIYELLSEMTVGPESNMGVTDAYHHVYFKLQDGTYVGYSFETAALLSVGGSEYKNYETGGSMEVWRYVRELQDEQMEPAMQIEPGDETDQGEPDDIYEPYSGGIHSFPGRGEAVTVSGPAGELSIVVPEDWYYTISTPQDSYLQISGYGIILEPAVDIEGYIELAVIDEPVGFCGTGIRNENITLGGKDAIAAYDEWAENGMWDHVIFTGTDERIIAVAFDCGSDLWGTDYGVQALKILDTLEFTAY